MNKEKTLKIEIKNLISKLCSHCNNEYPLDRFMSNKKCVGGYTHICKDCRNIYSRKWKKKHSKRINLLRRKKYAASKTILKVKDKNQCYTLDLFNSQATQEKYWLRADTDEGMGITEKRLFDLFDKLFMEEF